MDQLIEKIKNLKEIFEDIDICVFIKDPQLRVVYMNPAFVRFTGYSHSRVLYEDTADFLRGNTIQIRESLGDDSRIISGSAVKTIRTINLQNARDEVVIMRVIKTPLAHRGAVLGVLCVAEDVSDSYRMHYIWVRRAIEKLSPGERMVLFQYSRGLKRAEVARALKLSPSAADTTWQRAREKLQLSESDLKLFLRFYNDLIDNIYTD
ncbi:MAG: hypothetical protein CVV49_08490 [Spirochaetae bacterium HGW-Spirochaetae-5]|nr:MAG: hypothetical protein CVV49_08490 [Spirochaetae bacterium HGW-Spirochaetae-5]